MTAHELARALLEMPEGPVLFYSQKDGCWYNATEEIFRVSHFGDIEINIE